MKINREAVAVFVLIIPILLSGCGGKKSGKGEGHDPAENQIINAELQQFSRVVDSIPSFDGATCLICIDVTLIGSKVNLDWAIRANNNPAEPQWNPILAENEIINEINAKLAQCPAGSNAKIQFMYHLDPKPVYQKDAAGKIITAKDSLGWPQYLSVEAVLKRLAQQQNPRITKIYLASCRSQERPSTVNEAFKIPGVTHVITVDDIIELQCGSLKGAKYPTFEPRPVRVIVWEKENGKQIAKIPRDPVSEKEKFDINTNTVVPR